MEKKVTIIIPCYNYGEYIEEAVDSCLASTYENLEIIVVDDGSTDSYTIKKLEQISNKPKTRVIKQVNGGLSSARNFGFRNADAEYVLTLDADDKIAPTFIEKALWILENNNEYAYVYSLVQLFGEQQHVWETKPYNFSFLKYRNIIPATIFIRYSAWETIGGYDEKMMDGYEDWEFIIRLGKNSLTGFHLNEILFFYRKHHGSMLGDSQKKHNILVKYIKNKHSDIYKVDILGYFHYIFQEFILLIKKKLNLIIYFQKKPNKIIKKIYYKFFKRNLGVFEKNEFQTITSEASFNKEMGGKLKVLIILPWLNVGGVEKVFLNLTNYLKDNIDFYVVTTKSQRHHPWEEKFLNNVKAVYHLGAFSNRDKIAFLNYLSHSKSINTVHISNSQFGYMFAPILKLNFPDIKIIDTLHMEEPWSIWDYFRFSIPYNNVIDKRVVLTKRQKESLVNLIPDIDQNKIAVIPNGIELEKYDFKVSPQSQKAFKIAFVARLSLQKQPILFLEVAKIAKEMKRPFIFYLIGDGELLDLCQKYVKRNKLESYVIIQNFTKDINQFFSEMDILCIPSLMEGLPVTGLEAMAIGVPIVATDVPGWNDIIINKVNGCLTETDANLIFESIDNLYTDQDLYNVIKLNGKETVQKYTNEIMSERYLELYASEDKR
ncbi:MAG: glycosyltransferase [Bacilli bacterium]